MQLAQKDMYFQRNHDNISMDITKSLFCHYVIMMCMVITQYVPLFLTYQHILLKRSSKTGVTSAAGTAYHPYGPPELLGLRLLSHLFYV